MSDSRSSVLRLEQVRKRYAAGAGTVDVLHGIDLEIAAGSFTALVGPSGSGKSTLLNLMGLLDRPSEGELWLDGQATRKLDDGARTALRGSKIGFVFQFHHLIPAFSVLENVMMPVMVTRGRADDSTRERALGLLDQVGLASRAAESPTALSGGQQQRVAIARALVTRPPLLLADEPTGNLDTQTASDVFRLLREVNADFGCAVIIVTHDLRLARQCDRIVALIDGRLATPDELASLS